MEVLFPVWNDVMYDLWNVSDYSLNRQKHYSVLGSYFNERGSLHFDSQSFSLEYLSKNRVFHGLLTKNKDRQFMR